MQANLLKLQLAEEEAGEGLSEEEGPVLAVEAAIATMHEAISPTSFKHHLHFPKDNMVPFLEPNRFSLQPSMHRQLLLQHHNIPRVKSENVATSTAEEATANPSSRGPKQPSPQQSPASVLLYQPTFPEPIP